MNQTNWKQIGMLVAAGAVGGALTLSGWLVAYDQGWIERPTAAPVLTDATDGNKTSGTVLTEGEMTVEEVVAKVVPTVVAISSTDNVRTIFGVRKQTGAGSGFIIRSDGLIVTNNHVVSSTTATYTVKLSTGKNYPATVTARDPSSDLALVKIAVSNLPIAELGDSSTVTLGQRVIAIGDALGEYQNTVTTGIISGLNRSITAGDGQGATQKLDGLIQTDAAINPGNSGGPLVNLSGQVIGINTAIDASGEAVGFAIPINNVKSQIQTVSAGGELVYPRLGVRYVLIDQEFAADQNLTVTDGALVARGRTKNDVAVQPDSPADEAGIEEGDILLSINGEKITAKNSLSTILRQYKPGDIITVRLLRGNLAKTVEVTLGKL